MAVRNDMTVDQSLSPRVIRLAAPATTLSLQDMVDTVRILEERFENMGHPFLISASGKEDLGDGVQVGITVQENNARLAFEARRTPAIDESTVTTGSGAPNAVGRYTFIDTGADFTAAGVEAGSLVINWTDRSMADVVEVISSTELRMEALVNGTDNEMQVADVYSIFNIIQVRVSAGNLTAVDDLAASINAVLPTAFTQVVVAQSSSATLLSTGSLSQADIDNIADGVWDEQLSGHATAGSAGKALSDVETTTTTIDGKVDTIDSNVDAVLIDTAEIGVAGAGLTNIPWNASWDVEVQSEVTDALVAYNAVATTDLPTNFADLAITATTGRVTVGTNLDKTGYDLNADQSAVTIGTVTTNTDMRGTDNALLAASAPTNFSDLAITVTTGEVTVGTNNDKVGYTVSTNNDKTGYTISGTLTTLDALDTAQDSQHSTTQGLITGLNDPSATTIADAVWDEPLAGHVTAGTAGKALGDIDTNIGTAGAGLTAIPWNSAWDIEVESEVTDALVAYNAVATTDLPTNFADMSITVTTGEVTVGTNNDKTGYSISGTITTLDGLNDPTAGAIADAVWDEPLDDHQTAGSTGAWLKNKVLTVAKFLGLS